MKRGSKKFKVKKILYVEDNEDTADAVKIMLSEVGYQIDTVLCGKDALSMAKGNNYDLFLLDIMLPDMSGWDVFEKLKGKSKAKFAFLSAIPVSGERMSELSKVGVVDYITKPFDKEDLIKRISIILQN